jgi:hypothetical protein
LRKVFYGEYVVLLIVGGVLDNVVSIGSYSDGGVGGTGIGN